MLFIINPKPFYFLFASIIFLFFIGKFYDLSTMKLISAYNCNGFFHWEN